MDDWEVIGNGPIVELDEGLWTVEGKLPGMPLPRRMVIARRADGRLLIHNAIAMGATQMAELESFGPVGFIVVPNRFHRLDAGRFKVRYPDAKVLCPPRSRHQVEKRVPWDITYDDYPADARTRFIPVSAIRGVEGILEVTTATGVTLVFCDLLFNVASHFPGAKGAVMKLLGSTGGPRVPWLFRLVSRPDMASLSAELLNLADTPRLVRLIPGHGEVVEAGAAETLRRVAAAPKLVA